MHGGHQRFVAGVGAGRQPARPFAEQGCQPRQFAAIRRQVSGGEFQIAGGAYGAPA